MKLTQHIYLVGGGRLGLGLSHESDCHIYLVDGGEALALIDTGSGLDTPWLLRNIAAEGFDPHRIARIFLTHPHIDHAGGAAYFQQTFGAEVVCSAEVALSLASGDEEPTGLAECKRLGWYPEAYRVPACPVAHPVSGGERFQVGELTLSVISAPGHCLGHMAYLLEEGGSRQLFSGDAVFAFGRVLLEYLPGADMWQYRQTMVALAKLEIRGIFPGHGGFSVEYGQDFVKAAAEKMVHAHVPGNLF
ncbi:MAG: MBL fold metallo-hydrolase [Chloroflexi bacterium]|nr:MBL fold metallo-hydrolase [Chloroflexota bacterium]